MSQINFRNIKSLQLLKLKKGHLSNEFHMLLGNWIQIPKIWNRSLYVGQTSIPLFFPAVFSHQEHSLQVKSNNELSFMASRGPFMIPKAISGPIENLWKDRQSTCTQYKGRDTGGFFLIIGRSICKKLIHTHTLYYYYTIFVPYY